MPNVLRILFLYLLAQGCYIMANGQNNMATVRTNYLASYAFTSRYGQTVKPIPSALILSRIDTDGSFVRPNRNGTERDITDSVFKVLYVYEHVDSSTYYHNSAVKGKLYRAVNHWLNNYPGFTWTGSAMAQPAALGMVLAKLYDDFEADASDPEYAAVITNIRQKAKAFLRFSWSKGASKATFMNPNLGDDPHETYDWQRMGNAGYRILGYTGIAIGCNDSTSMDTIAIIMNNQFPLQINKPSQSSICGAAYDGSLFQHGSPSPTFQGSQFYNLGYGTDWARDLARYSSWVRNTKWSLTTSQQEAWANILLNGMQWVQYKGRTAHNILGRASGSNGPAGTQLSGMLSEFTGQASTSIPQRALLDALHTRLGNSNYQLDSSKYFWNSHILLQHSSRYFAAIRMLSIRAIGSESTASAGGSGHRNFYMADGSTMLYRKGTEYDNVRVGWNWRCIPGTTVRQKTGALPLVPWGRNTESNNVIAGGVSDGSTSIGVFNLSRTHSYAKTKAFKSYFSFKDALVCVGNSITDNDAASGDIYTTINQTERLTDTYYSINGGSEQTLGLAGTLNTSFGITSPSWFWQDSMGYIILPRSGAATQVVLSAETRTGNWQDIDNTNPDLPASVNIFQLGINHGSAANGWYDTSYRYVVVPSVSKSDLVDFFTDRILTANESALYINYNDRTIAVSYSGYTGIFFTNAGFTKAVDLGADSLNVSASNYAAVLIRRKQDGMNVHVGDVRNGFYSSTPVTLGINRVLKSSSFTPDRASGPVTLAPASDSTRITLDLSKTNELYMGEPVHISAFYLPQLLQDTILTNADAFVNNGGSSATNYGVNSYMTVSNGGSGFTREAYLKFDLHGKITGNLLNAKLRLYNQSKVTGVQWDLYKVTDDSWTETGINWNNRPVTGIDSLTTAKFISPDTAAIGYITWDITNALQTIGTDSILTLKLAFPATASYVYTSFASRQNAAAAQRPVIITATEGLYADNDGDGFGAGAVTPYGQVTNNTDCNDNDAAVHAPQTYYRDADEDGFGNAADSVIACSATPPAGYTDNKRDCDDTRLLYADQDGDGYGTGAAMACGVPDNADCNDADASIHTSQVYYRDADGDGYVNPADSVVTCTYTAPAGYMNNTVPVPVADTVDVLADAFVNNGGSAGTNYGFASYMTVSNGGSGFFREAYLKFDMHGKMPPNTVDLKLRVYLQAPVTGVEWYLYRVPDNSWTEGGINGNNKPPHDTLLLSSFAGNRDVGYVLFDMYKVLQGMGTDSIITVKLMGAASAPYVSSGFASRQNGTPAFRPVILTTRLQYTGDTLLTDCDDSDPAVHGPQAKAMQKANPVIPVHANAGLRVYPNPVSHTTTLEFSAETASRPYRVTISDITGRTLQLLKGLSIKGSNKLPLTLVDYAAGVYWATVYMNGKSRAVKIVKK